MGLSFFLKKEYFLSINSTVASCIVYDILFFISFITLIKVHVNGNFPFAKFRETDICNFPYLIFEYSE